MRVTLCLALLAAFIPIWADPCWPGDVVVREGQDLVYEGASVQNPDGSVVLAWIQSLGGDCCLLVNKVGADGMDIWPEPVLVKSSLNIKSAAQIVRTSDGGCFLSWLEDTNSILYRLRAQKLSAGGTMLWNQEGVLVCEAFASTPEWLSVPNQVGGAFLFVNAYPGYGTTSQAFGCNFNSLGSNVWNADPPIIMHNGYTVLNSLLATPSQGGMLLLYRIQETQGNTYVFRHYTPEGVNDWELYFQPQPGELGPHQVLLSGPDKVLDLALAANNDTRINIRALSLNTGQWIPDETSSLLVDPLTAQGDSHLRALLRPDTGTVAIICATRQNDLAQVWEYLLDWQLAPVISRHIRSTADDIDDLELSASAAGKVHCAWTEKAGYDSDKVLKAQLLDATSGELAWPEGGISLSPTLKEGSHCDIFSQGNDLLAILAETGMETSHLKRRPINQLGDPLLPPQQEITATILNGYAWPSSCLKTGPYSVIIYSDSRGSPERRIYFQMLDEQGNTLLEPGGRLICAGDAMTAFVDARPLGDSGFAVLCKNDGLYLQTYDLGGNSLYPEQGILLCPQTSTRAKMAVHAGDIYVNWTENDNGVNRVKGQRIHAGRLMWGNGGLILADNLSQAPRGVGAPEGRYFTWSVQIQSGTHQIRGKLLDANGLELPGWNAESNLVLETSGMYDLFPAAVTMSGADLLIFAGGMGSENFYAQRVNSSGTLPWGAAGRLIHASPHMYMGCLADAAGITVGYGYYSGANRGAYLQTVDTGGNLLYPELGLLLDGNDMLGAGYMGLGRFEDGSLLVAWSANYIEDDLENLDLWYRRLDPGEQVEGKPQALATGPYGQNAPLIAGSGEQDLIICWADARSGGSGVQPRWGVYAQKFSGGGSPTPPEPDIPETLIFNACYPNPFGDEVMISWTQKDSRPAYCSIHNLRGQAVKHFPPAEARAGEHLLSWDGTDTLGREVGAGIYFIRLRSGGETQIRKLLKL